MPRSTGSWPRDQKRTAFIVCQHDQTDLFPSGGTAAKGECDSARVDHLRSFIPDPASQEHALTFPTSHNAVGLEGHACDAACLGATAGKSETARQIMRITSEGTVQATLAVYKFVTEIELREILTRSWLGEPPIDLPAGNRKEHQKETIIVLLTERRPQGNLIATVWNILCVQASDSREPTGSTSDVSSLEIPQRVVAETS